MVAEGDASVTSAVGRPWIVMLRRSSGFAKRAAVSAAMTNRTALVPAVRLPYRIFSRVTALAVPARRRRRCVSPTELGVMVGLDMSTPSRMKPVLFVRHCDSSSSTCCPAARDTGGEGV